MADAAIKRSSPDGLALSSLPGAVVTGAGLVPPISSARVAVCLCARQAGASDQRNERNTWGGTGWPMTADKRLPGPFTPPSQACVRRAAVLGGDLRTRDFLDDGCSRHLWVGSFPVALLLGGRANPLLFGFNSLPMLGK